MRAIRWSRPVGIAVAASMVWFGIGGSVKAHPSLHPTHLTTVTLQLKWVPQAQFDGYYAAKDKGFYSAEGLDVTIKAGGPQIAPEEVVQSGGADFGIDWLSALLKSRDEGLNLQNIAQIYQATGMRMIAFKSTGINTIKKFASHTVGVWPSGNEYQFYALMHKMGMAPPQKYMKVVTEGFVMTPFLNHQLDVAHAMTYNELGVVLESGVKMSQLNIFDYNQLGVSILEDGIFGRTDWLKSHKDIVVRFLRASIKGWQWAVAHPDAAGKLTFNHTQSGSTTQAHQIYMAREVAKLVHYGPGLSHTIGYMDPAAFARTWQTLYQQKVIHHPASSAAYNQNYWAAAGGH